MVERRRDVPHEAHQEERDAQDGIGKEIQPSYELIIPSYGIEVDKEGREP